MSKKLFTKLALITSAFTIFGITQTNAQASRRTVSQPRTTKVTKQKTSQVQPPQWHWMLVNPQTGRAYYQFAADFPYKSEMMTAINQWNTAMGYQLIQPADSSHPATFYIDSQDDANADDFSMTSVFGGVYFNSAFKSYCQGTNIYRHELGHVLGLDDTTDSRLANDVMYEYSNDQKGNTTISSADVAAVKTALQEDLPAGETDDQAVSSLVSDPDYIAYTIYGDDVQTISSHPSWTKGTKYTALTKEADADYQDDNYQDYLTVIKQLVPIIKNVIQTQGYNDWLSSLEN